MTKQFKLLWTKDPGLDANFRCVCVQSYPSADQSPLAARKTRGYYEGFGLDTLPIEQRDLALSDDREYPIHPMWSSFAIAGFLIRFLVEPSVHLKSFESSLKNPQKGLQENSHCELPEHLVRIGHSSHGSSPAYRFS